MSTPRFAQAHACFRHQREEANKVGQFSQKQFIEMMAAILYFQLQDFDLSSTFLCLQIMALVDKWINKQRDKILRDLVLPINKPRDCAIFMRTVPVSSSLLRDSASTPWKATMICICVIVSMYLYYCICICDSSSLILSGSATTPWRPWQWRNKMRNATHPR